MDKPSFKKIPQLPWASYRVDVSLHYIDERINDFVRDGLVLEPDFQRGHVWRNAQRVAYVEYLLQGGTAANQILFNCPNFTSGERGTPETFVLIDGLQRLTAVRKFMKNEIKAFGHYYKDYTDRLSSSYSLQFKVVELNTREEILAFYLTLNSGGVVHSKKELERVRKLLEDTRPKMPLYIGQSSHAQTSPHPFLDSFHGKKKPHRR